MFLRGANVGGHRTFRPSELARSLRPLEVASLGAAGTFVVRGSRSASAVRAVFAKSLPFECDILVCAGDDVAALVRRDPFARLKLPKGAKTAVTILAGEPAAVPKLPLERPVGKPWEVRLLRVNAPFVASVWRTNGPRLGLYPNEVVERELGVPATTRSWTTFQSLAQRLAVR